MSYYPEAQPQVVIPVVVAKIEWMEDLEGFIETQAYSS